MPHTSLVLNQSALYYLGFAISLSYMVHCLRSIDHPLSLASPGEKRKMNIVFTLSSFPAMLTGLAYLVYYGWRVAWWAPLPIFIAGLFALNLFGPRGRVVRKAHGTTITFLGFFSVIAWPVLAYFMFTRIPA